MTSAKEVMFHRRLFVCLLAGLLKNDFHAVELKGGTRAAE